MKGKLAKEIRNKNKINSIVCIIFYVNLFCQEASEKALIWKKNCWKTLFDLENFGKPSEKKDYQYCGYIYTYVYV